MLFEYKYNNFLNNNASELIWKYQLQLLSPLNSTYFSGRTEKTEQSILVDNEWLDTETIAIFQTGTQVLKKNDLRSLTLGWDDWLLVVGSTTRSRSDYE